MDIDWLAVVFRWMHILAAITAVGGTIFMRLALLPASEGLTEDARRSLHDSVRARWVIPLNASILFLLVSGFYNFFMMVRDYTVPGSYHALFGIKFLLAMAIFFIASMLVGRSAASERFRQNRRRWLSLNVALAVVLVCISGVLRAMPRTEKSAEPAPSSGRAVSTSHAAEFILPAATRRIILDDMERLA